MPTIRTGRKLPSEPPPVGTGVTGTAAVVFRKMALAGTGTVSGPQQPTDFGPTGGAQVVRDGAGHRTGTVTIFAGSSPGSFTRITTAMSQAQIQTAINTDTTGKVWWEKGLYEGPWSAINSAVWTLDTVSNQEHRFETGPLRTPTDTAIIHGSEPVTGWTAGTGADLGYWSVTGQTQNFSSFHNSAGPDPYHNDHPPAGHTLEAYYRDNVLLQPAATKAAVLGRTDAVFFDRAGRAWLGSNPSGHTFARLGSFFTGTFRVRVPGITIKGGIFRHSGFANFYVERISTPLTPNNFTLQDCEMSYGRLANLRVIGASTPDRISNVNISYCTFHHGGRYNFAMTNVNTMTISYVETYNGNMCHFGNRVVGTFDEGSDKTLFCDSMWYHHNWFHDNDGPGSWQDTRVEDFLHEQCVVENNFGAGVHHEDNTRGTFRYNYFENNQKDGNQEAPFNGTATGWPTLGGWSYKGGGMWISRSSFCEIHNNHMVGNKHATFYIRGDDVGVHRLDNMWLHDNLVYHADGDSAQEYMISYRDSSAYVSLATSNNKYNFNTYHVPAAGRGQSGATFGTQQWFFAPSGASRTFTEWKQGMTAIDPTFAPASYFDPNSTLATDL